MTSGGDPTIERKAALTTTTPIRKRKSDGGGLAVLIALLFVVVAAGYYFLTQNGGFNALLNEETPAIASSETDTAGAAVSDSTETNAVLPDVTVETSGAPAVPPAEEAEARNKASGTVSQNEPDTDSAAAPKPAGTDTEPNTSGTLRQDSAPVQTANVPAETPIEPAAVPEVPVILNNATLKEIEELLLRLQIDPGPTDGVIDNQTATAIRLYQEIAGLPVDGKTSPDLLIELREVVELLSNE